MGSSRNRPAPGPPGGDGRHGPGHRRRRPPRRRPAGPDPPPHHRGGGPGNAAVRFAARWKDSRRGGGAVNRLDCQRSSRTYQFSTPVGALGSGTGLLVWILTEMKMMAVGASCESRPEQLCVALVASASASNARRCPIMSPPRSRAPVPLPPQRVAMGSLPVSVVVALECSHGRCRAALVVPACLSDRAVVVVDDCLAQRPDALDHDRLGVQCQACSWQAWSCATSRRVLQAGCSEHDCRSPSMTGPTPSWRSGSIGSPLCADSRRMRRACRSTGVPALGRRPPSAACIVVESAKRRRRDLEGGRRWRSRKERGNGMVLRTTRAAQTRPGTTARTTGGGAVRGRIGEVARRRPTVARAEPGSLREPFSTTAALPRERSQPERATGARHGHKSRPAAGCAGFRVRCACGDQENRMRDNQGRGRAFPVPIPPTYTTLAASATKLYFNGAVAVAPALARSATAESAAR